MFNRYRRKRPKMDASIFDSTLSHTCRSDASEKKRRKYSRSLLAKFACGQVSSPRLYRLIPSGSFYVQRIVERSLWLVPKNLPLRAEKTVPIFYRLNLGNRIICEVSVSYSAPGNCSQVPSRVSPTLRLAKATLTLIPVMGMQNLLFILIPSQARSKSCKFSSDTMKFQKFYIAKLF